MKRLRKSASSRSRTNRRKSRARVSCVIRRSLRIEARNMRRQQGASTPPPEDRGSPDGSEDRSSSAEAELAVLPQQNGGNGGRVPANGYHVGRSTPVGANVVRPPNPVSVQMDAEGSPVHFGRGGRRVQRNSGRMNPRSGRNRTNRRSPPDGNDARASYADGNFPGRPSGNQRDRAWSPIMAFPIQEHAAMNGYQNGHHPMAWNGRDSPYLGIGEDDHPILHPVPAFAVPAPDAVIQAPVQPPNLPPPYFGPSAFHWVRPRRQQEQHPMYWQNNQIYDGYGHLPELYYDHYPYENPLPQPVAPAQIPIRVAERNQNPAPPAEGQFNGEVNHPSILVRILNSGMDWEAQRAYQYAAYGLGAPARRDDPNHSNRNNHM